MKPEDPEHGVWDCPMNDLCYLHCDPGFVPLTPGNRPNYCASGVWSLSVESVSCTQGVVLLQGGPGKNTTEVFSPTKTCTNKLPEHHLPHYGHTMEYIGVPVMCGGRIHNETVPCECWVLEDNKEGVKEWREFDHSTQEHRSFGSSIENNGVIWLVGGSLSNQSTEYISPGLEWEPGFNLTDPLVFGCALRLSTDSMIVISSDSGQGDSTVTKYFTDGRSEKLPNLNTKRSGFACSLVGNQTFTGILVAGGSREDAALATSELYDWEREEWQEVDDLTVARAYFKMFAIDGGVLALGGVSSSDMLSSVEKFNLSTNKWEIVGNLSEPRALYAAALVPAEQFCEEDTTPSTAKTSTEQIPVFLILFTHVMQGIISQ